MTSTHWEEWIDDESPGYVWEMAIAQLIIAGVSATWFLVADQYAVDRAWVEQNLVAWYVRLNVLAVFLVPLAISILLFLAAARRSLKFVVFAAGELVLWYAHLQAMWPWVPS